ncbi:uncharacterized protein AC631_03364 [Debaryomyces fabryi]|uniref:RWD domain-containing protein n=1 Tax=Debaryomyces fabryi TaxID=58627 RepID=A0A0V1PY53_9ASCO|nr:uncharacterized protein AC631_03364 [Debaryomyces fabryi]KSA00879.1 hypothetical protein AC631_03364 [Debaryomyces fabryi]CUM46073.1 unnamed protein product [Debaryomyces fabryi]
MDPQEEQQLELEVLESIYPDELTKYSPTHFSIKLSLDTPSERKHRLLLDVKYPAEYPEVVPDLNIIIPEEEEEEEISDEESDEENENETKLMLNLSETIEFDSNDVDQLVSKLIEEANLQVGMPSVFALTTQLKDEAEILFQNKLEQTQKKYDEDSLAREMEEQKKFHGTKVTKESWNEWRNKFREEMKIAERDLENFNKMHNGKLSGREIFEKGLAGDDEDILNDITDNVKNVSVS